MFLFKGNREKIEEAKRDLKEHAIDYYGERYRERIEQITEETEIYDMEDNDLSTALKDIIGPSGCEELDISVPNKERIESFFFINTLSSNYRQVVLCRGNQSVKKIKSVLAHELYGHAFFGVRKLNVDDSNITYLQNGFTIYEKETGVTYRPMWTEGCATLTQEELMARSRINFTPPQEYTVALQSAKFLEEVIGHKRYVEALINNSCYEVMGQFDEELSDLTNSQHPFQAIESLSSLHKEGVIYQKKPPTMYQTQLFKIIDDYRDKGQH